MGNVVVTINRIVEIIPRKWGNVRSLHLKFLESRMLPIYKTTLDLKLKIEIIKGVEEEVKVKEEEIERLGEDEKVGEKKAGDDDNEDMGEGNVTEDDEVNVDELRKKKRKKRDAVSNRVLGELNAEKRVTKFAKLKDEEG
ncbi:hypothetical protein FNV43_RR21686 [Rhamnella rubrinervis]|uniref:Uncharacterized protein n=1 Tax=Rhamnella rubrinervis TaxID=2594499 RepID=A0A8K0DQ52_9ROSA|nr:hypothetical protein FNV43_RR21686 [Rhamnella rubrinervis]